MARIKIVMTGHGDGTVFVDGNKVEMVSAIDFHADASGGGNILTLTMLAGSVEIEGPAEVIEQ